MLGESEILGQVRSAWELAQDEGGAKATLNLLFRHAIETGKRARTETGIGRGTASVSHAAVEMATERLGTWPASVCSSSVPARWAKASPPRSSHAGANDIVVANRTVERADQLASAIGGRVVPFADLPTALGEADVLLTCTGAGGRRSISNCCSRPADAVGAAAADRRHRRAPRRRTPKSPSSPASRCSNLDDLRDWAARASMLRAEEAASGSAIVSEEVERFAVEVTARQAAPLVAQLHEQPTRSGTPRSSGSRRGWPRSTTPSGPRSKPSRRASSPSCCTRRR